MNLKHNLWQLLIAIDQVLNVCVTLCGETAYADESLSSRAYRWERDGVRAWPMRIINSLFFWQDNHCLASYTSEAERRHSPPEFRE